MSVATEKFTSAASTSCASPLPIQRAPVALPREAYSYFLAAATGRKPNPIRNLDHHERQPGMITLLAGKPNASVFPMTSFQFTVRSPIDPVHEELLSITGPDLVSAIQYGPTRGYAPLLDWVAGLQELLHGRKKGEGWATCTTSGSQDALYKAADAVINPGDFALVESPAYVGISLVLEKLKCNIIPVESDHEGIKSSSLQNILENWPRSRPFPKFLYTVPFGCNPSGVTTSIGRRRETLTLARKYNFLIFEDDPYYHLYYGKLPRPKSYFELELEQPDVGRVVRFDSLSKILGGGLRIGFASGPEAIIEAVDTHTSFLNLQTASMTQVVIDKLLRSWGYDGFQKHAERAASFYRRRRDKFENAMHRHLQGLAEWSAPDAGMFFWIKLLLNDPSDSNAAEGDSGIVLTLALQRKIVVLPGAAFIPDGKKTAYIRVSFSQLNEDDFEEAVKRVAQVIIDARVKKSAERAKL
ncbi:hypothetical protein M0805_002484 [Coniferiporia weirii]|nr:hypothetical protein M0805_002484 [Coniferiporia weirii]